MTVTPRRSIDARRPIAAAAPSSYDTSLPIRETILLFLPEGLLLPAEPVDMTAIRRSVHSSTCASSLLRTEAPWARTRRGGWRDLRRGTLRADPGHSPLSDRVRDRPLRRESLGGSRAPDRHASELDLLLLARIRWRQSSPIRDEVSVLLPGANVSSLRPDGLLPSLPLRGAGQNEPSRLTMPSHRSKQFRVFE